jgi:lactoylglutathione lyase
LLGKIDHVAIIVKDFEESLKFYNEILGFPIIQTWETLDSKEEPGVRLRIAYVGKEGSKIELMKFYQEREADIGKRVGLTHISILVDDMENTCKELKGKGIKLTMEPTSISEGLRIAFFKDPNGVYIELIEKKV